jgi:hypothetical protein
MWGFKSVKWINKIDARTDFSTYGTFETGDYAGQSPVDNPGLPALASFIFEPAAQIEVEGPDVQVVAGAMMGGQQIARIRVSLDDGPAEVIDTPSLEDILESSGHLGLLVRESLQYQSDSYTWPYPGILVPFRVALRGLAPGPHTVQIAAESANGDLSPAMVTDPTVAGPAARLAFTVV